MIMRTHDSDDAISKLKLDTLHMRRESHTLKLVHKCLNKKCPQFLQNYFTFNKNFIDRTTRQSNFLRLPSVRIESSKKAFYYHGCVVYNRNL